MATSADYRRCKVCVLVVIILGFSITILTRNRITCLLQKLLMTRHLLHNLLLRHRLFWLTWSSSLAQDVTIDTWNCCRKHVLHYSFVSSRLYLANGHSTRAKGVRRCLIGLRLLWEKRHHFIHFFIVNDGLLLSSSLNVRMFIVASGCAVIWELWFIRSTSYSFDWFNVNPNLFTK